MNGVNGIGGQAGLQQVGTRTSTGDNGAFSSVLKKALNSVNVSQNQADATVTQNLEGKAGIHDAMVSLQEADINLRFLLQVRNKALDAYREIMRMPF